MGFFDKNIMELKEFLKLSISEEDKLKINDMVKQLESSNIILENSFKNENNNNDLKIKIGYINKSNNIDPVYANEGDSGFDLRANIKDIEDVNEDQSGELYTIIKPMERKLIPTGLYFQLPVGCEMQIRPRSGIALKNGVTVLNSPGTVDTHFIGEIKVLLINLSSENFIIKQGDRIAQAVLTNRIGSEFGSLEKINNLKETKRGSSGFGSTGIS